MKKHLIFKDDKSNKFWNIEAIESSFTVNYGKIGTNGQSSTKSFDNETTCLNEANKLVSEKLKKGYSEEGVNPSESTISKPIEKATKQNKAKKEAQEIKTTDSISTISKTLVEEGNLESYLVAIRELITKNELMQASEWCITAETLAQSQNEKVQVALLFGEIQLIKGDYEKAEANLLKTGDDGFFLLGKLHNYKKDYLKAEHYYSKAKTYEGYYLAGWLTLKQPEKAINYFKQAIEIGEETNEKELWQSYFKCAYTLQNSGNLKEAEAYYKKAIATNKADAFTYNNLAVLCIVSNRNEEAILWLDEVIEKFPEFTVSYFNKCCLYAQEGDVVEALKWLKLALYHGYYFHNSENLNKDSDIEILRNTEEYKKLLEKHAIRSYATSCNNLSLEDFLKHPETYNRFTIYSYDKPLPNGILSDEIAKGINIESIEIEEGGLTAISNEIRKLKKLKKISLIDTPIKELPEAIFEMELEEVNLSFKFLKTYPYFLEKIKNLKKLTLGSIKVKNIPTEIAHLKNLQDFTIKHGEIEIIDKEIGSLSNLTSLEIRDTKITSVPKELSELKRLQQLYITDNKQLNYLPEEIFTLPNIQRMHFSKNGFPSTEATKLFEEGVNTKMEKRQLAVFLGLLQLNYDYVSTNGTFEDALLALNSSVSMLRSNTLIWLSNTLQQSFDEKTINETSEVIILGKFSKNNTEIKSDIIALGANVTTKLTLKTTHILIGEKPGEKIKELIIEEVQWVTEALINKTNIPNFDADMEIPADFPKEQILTLLHSQEETNLAMALELIRESHVAKLFETELFISFQFSSDKKNKKEIEDLIKQYCGVELQTALAGKYGFKSASEKKINEYIETFSTKTGLDKDKLAYIIFKKGNYEAKNYLLQHGTSKIKKEVLIALIDYSERTKQDPENPTKKLCLGSIIPDEIADIKHLIKKLQISGKFKELPLSICYLEDLEELSLRMTNFKTLPKEIAKLQKLKKLDISTCSFKKFPVEILALENLESLSISNENYGTSQAIAEIPDDIRKLKKLKTLDLTNNPLGKLPLAVCDLEQLESLSIRSIGMTEIPEEIGKLKNLKNLELDSSWGTDENKNVITVFPSTFSQLSNLKTLQIEYNLISKLPKESLEISNIKEILNKKNQNN